MRLRFAAVPLLVCSFAVAAFTRAGAQSTPAPLPSPSPIVVPTLAPSNGATDSIIRAAAGVVNDILLRQRINAANNTRGTVTFFKRFDMQVQTGSNSYRTIHLHQGTVINPRGATPVPGTSVDISGQGLSDGSLDANAITVLQ